MITGPGGIEMNYALGPSFLVALILLMSAPALGTDTDLKTFRDFLMQYNNVTEQCFGSCVTDMTSRSVSEKEEKCSVNCLDKYLKMTQRVSMRFQEHQMITHEAQGAALPRP